MASGAPGVKPSNVLHELVVAVLALVAPELEELKFSLTSVEPSGFEIASVVLGPVEPVAVAVLGVAVSDLGSADS